MLPVDGEPVRDGEVLVEGDRVAAVGRRLGPVDERFTDAVILPGLVNAHTHLEYASMGGFGDGLPFTPWIEGHIRRVGRLEREDFLVQARAGARACLAAGITTIGDCCFAATVGDAARETGLRAIVYVEFFSRNEPFGEGLEARLERVGDGGLVRAGISPHAPYTVTLDDYERLVAIARARGLPVATHLLESERETLPLEAFRGFLGPDTVAIHAVKLTPADIELLAQLDVPVVHCPRSNALLGCGIAPVPELLAAGVRVGLGTDSPSSALDFDPWAEMRAAIMLARGRAARPDALTAAEVLRLATAGGAATLGVGDEVGTLTPGKAADLTVLSLAATGFLPWDDPVSAVVYGGTPSGIVLTMVAGRILFRQDQVPSDLHPARRARAKMMEIER